VDSPDMAPDGRWLSYAELAEVRGITRKAAARLALRHRWRRQPGNDGATRVLVPPGNERRQAPRDDGALAPPSDTTAAAVWRERAQVAERRVDAADTDRRSAIALAEQTVTLLTDAVARADRAETAIAAERQRADALRDRLDGMQRDLDAARRWAQDAAQDANAMRQAEAERKGRGRWARLRAAWRRGE
jgi:hypothetical protein